MLSLMTKTKTTFVLINGALEKGGAKAVRLERPVQRVRIRSVVDGPLQAATTRNVIAKTIKGLHDAVDGRLILFYKKQVMTFFVSSVRISSSPEFSVPSDIGGSSSLSPFFKIAWISLKRDI